MEGLIKTHCCGSLEVLHIYLEKRIIGDVKREKRIEVVKVMMTYSFGEENISEHWQVECASIEATV